MEVLARSTKPDQELACGHCRSRNLEKMISSPAAVGIGSSSRQGKTCCGKDERCDAPPCSSGRTCGRDWTCLEYDNGIFRKKYQL